MNRERILIGLAVALVVSFLASRYVYQQIRQAQVGGRGVKVTPVVLAAAPLKLGQRLEAADLKLVDWPSDQKPQGSFSRIQECVGRALMAPVVENEAILEEKLASKEGGSGLAVAIPPGMRAVSAGVDDVVAVSGFVTVGTVVDVMVTGVGTVGSVTRIILQHVRVLAVGQQLQADANGKPQVAPVVTFLVTPEDAEKLTLAEAQGKIHLALRNTADTADVNPPPAYGSAMFLGGVPAPPSAGVPRTHVKAAPPLAAPPPPPTIQVIRGDKVENQIVPR
jgi:pilus assembly protein CpaB